MWSLVVAVCLMVCEPYGAGQMPAQDQPQPAANEADEAEVVVVETYEQQFARLVLTELGIQQHPVAVGVLVAWQQVEACRWHNPLCRLTPDRRVYRYDSIEAGAEVVAATLDVDHPDRPDGWQHHYPQVVAGLRLAPLYRHPSEVIRAVRSDLRRWCGPPSICGDESRLSYAGKLVWRADRYWTGLTDG